MSAWLLDPAHFDVVAAGLVAAGLAGNHDHKGALDALAEVNGQSYGHRYSHHEETAQEVADMLASLASYQPRAMALWRGDEPTADDREAAVAALAKATSCYRYQSCEHPGWADDPMNLRTMALLGWLADRTDGGAVSREWTDRVSGWPVEPEVLDLWLAGDFTAGAANKALYGR